MGIRKSKYFQTVIAKKHSVLLKSTAYFNIHNSILTEPRILYSYVATCNGTGLARNSVLHVILQLDNERKFCTREKQLEDIEWEQKSKLDYERKKKPCRNTQFSKMIARYQKKWVPENISKNISRRSRENQKNSTRTEFWGWRAYKIIISFRVGTT